MAAPILVLVLVVVLVFFVLVLVFVVLVTARAEHSGQRAAADHVDSRGRQQVWVRPRTLPIGGRVRGRSCRRGPCVVAVLHSWVAWPALAPVALVSLRRLGVVGHEVLDMGAGLR